MTKEEILSMSRENTIYNRLFTFATKFGWKFISVAVAIYPVFGFIFALYGLLGVEWILNLCSLFPMMLGVYSVTHQQYFHSRNCKGKCRLVKSLKQSEGYTLAWYKDEMGYVYPCNIRFKYWNKVPKTGYRSNELTVFFRWILDIGSLFLTLFLCFGILPCLYRTLVEMSTTMSQLLFGSLE